jgi:hypothetical protein
MKAFISYSHRDEAILDRLHVHLAMLRREGLIDEWYDRAILAGADIDTDIARHLDESRVFIAIVSPDFLHSNYCYETEMQQAIERVDSGQMQIVPIIAEPCEWQRSPLGKYKAVPKDGKPISEWTNANNAFLDIVTELRRLVQADAPNSAPAQRPGRTDNKKRYRIKRSFDEIDRADFRDSAFETIRLYFKNAVAEIEGVEGIRARYRDLGATSFGCTVLNQLKERGVGHITLHRGGERHGMGDISYNFTENASPNSANGWLTIQADEFELYLRLNAFSGMKDDDRISPDDAAKHLWEELLDRAGITTND